LTQPLRPSADATWPLLRETFEVDDLAVMEVVGSEPEAELICSILRDAGIRCMQRITNAGSGASDGIAVGGSREIVVRADELAVARELIREQKSG